MMTQPIPLTPEETGILIRCPLHYHFLQQNTPLPAELAAQAELSALVRQTIQALHTAGGPARLPLDECLWPVVRQPVAKQMVEHYYQRLARDWPRVMAANETMSLNISLAGVGLTLYATLDRLDKTSDGGILGIIFRTGAGPLPGPDELRQNPALTIYHALVATTYPLKRPVRIQELWLQLNEEVTIELSEDEYRRNLARLRQPVHALARGEVMARPGLHCDSCPFKHRGCPVYSHDEDPSDELDSSAGTGKMSPRKWIFKI